MTLWGGGVAKRNNKYAQFVSNVGTYSLAYKPGHPSDCRKLQQCCFQKFPSKKGPKIAMDTLRVYASVYAG